MSTQPNDPSRWMLPAAAILGALGVALGAFGAHGLEAHLAKTRHVATWETAARYHLIHAAVLLALALAPRSREVRALRTAGLFFLIGSAIFAGTLYLLSVTGIGMFGAVTPLGGAFLIAGWIWLIGASLNRGRNPSP